MSIRTYIACHQAVSAQHRNAPNSFLDQLIDTINGLPDAAFEANNLHDIYSVMLGALGPYTGILHRKAVMCEVLRVQAAFESDWHWERGVDPCNASSMAHKEGEETGAFQVSWDSMPNDPSLPACVDRYAHAHDVDTFIKAMKENHALAVEYCARLLRFNTRWCGTLNDASMVIAHVRRDAVSEFQGFLQLNPTAATAEPSLTEMALHVNAGVHDRQFISRLLAIGRDSTTLDNAQLRAGKKLMRYDGEVFPQNACAITLSTLLQDAGIIVPDIFQALALGIYLHSKRGWTRVDIGDQQAGDIGSTCGENAQPGNDHIYIVSERVDNDQMIVIDNQESEAHIRFVTGKNKTPTTFFLRAT
ncbi:hypothetical protein AAKU55_004660 [Oxalobacteraceae bacterium GrIS 1.11]